MRSTKSINPNEFKNYRPTDLATITQAQAQCLAGFIREQDSKYMLLYIWRFSFGISVKIMEQYARVENVHGIVEAFRFACKRYLNIEKSISNSGMAKAFGYVLLDYEVMLLSRREGLCWLSGKCFDYSVTVREALADMEQRQIEELEDMPPPVWYLNLNKQQIKSLAKHITGLPLHYGFILCAYCVHGLSYGEIESKFDIRHARGTVEYIRAVLTHKMRLSHPVSDSHMKQAIELHTNISFHLTHI